MGLGARIGRGLDTLFAVWGGPFPESKQHEEVASRTIEDPLPL